MNKRWIHILSAIAFGILIPGLLLLTVSGSHNDVQQADSTIMTTLETNGLQTDSTERDVLDLTVLCDDGNVYKMELEDYIAGVVLAEMPASFEIEALKAQAVVARTYALRRLGGNAKHSEASVCTDPGCCQGYSDKDQYLRDGGTVADLQKIQQAVFETSGVVLVFQGELIEATYFSCSGGSTEDASAVWGEDIPYLQATTSPGEEKAAHYTDTTYFTAAEFSNLLGIKSAGDPSTWFGGVNYTDGRGVETIQICGEEFKGVSLRKLLGLRSTAFTITAIGDAIVITTKGFGHRVGMSQYGADAMAVQGCSYPDILAHYYQGTELKIY